MFPNQCTHRSSLQGWGSVCENARKVWVAPIHQLVRTKSMNIVQRILAISPQFNAVSQSQSFSALNLRRISVSVCCAAPISHFSKDYTQLLFSLPY